MYFCFCVFVFTLNVVFGTSNNAILPLCCPEEEIFDGTNCVPRNQNLEEYLHLNFEEPKYNGTIIKSYQPVNCSTSSIEIVLNKDVSTNQIWVQNDGSVTFRWQNINESVPRKTSEFCVLRSNVSEINIVRVCYLNKPLNDSTTTGSSNTSVDVVNKKMNFIDCTKNLCISKCCLPDYHLSLNERPFKCVPSQSNESMKFLPQFKYQNGTKALLQRPVAYIVRLILCKLRNDFYLFPNGSLFLPTTKEIFSIDQYCIEVFDLRETSFRASVCSKNLERSINDVLSKSIHPLCFFISCIFLAITFVCHLIIPRLRDMQGRCFMSHTFALFFTFLLLSVTILIPNNLSRNGCLAVAILTQYSFLSAFFWLNVMCFDIWRIIRGSIHAVRLQDMQGSIKTIFILYSIYGWGGPMLVCIAPLVIHLLPQKSIPDYILKPGFSTTKCWYPNDIKVLFAYFNGIVAFLFFLNMIFVIHTCMMLYRAGVAFMCCRSKTGHGEELRRHQSKLLSMFWHRFCIFSLIAINWTTEVLSFIPPPEMWVLTDILNSLQGFFIFLIFIRSAKKRALLRDAWKKIINKARIKKGLRPHGQPDAKYIERAAVEKNVEGRIELLVKNNSNEIERG